MLKVRPEAAEDQAAVFEVNSAAFETDLEARLVDELRKVANPMVSLVAEVDGKVVGHILFTPISVGGTTAGSRRMGLAPMAVLPAFQNQGIGSALVKGGIDDCRKLGTELAFVLGHADFYPRFGFEPVAPKGLHYVDPSLDAHFFVLELVPNALRDASGEVEYHSLFSTLGA